MSEMNDRQQKANAMRERLRQFSQGPSDNVGPLPGVGTAERHDPLPPHPPETEVSRWRSQGITVYSVDDVRLERLAQFFRSRGVRFGRRGQISLLAGAGIAALESLLETDPSRLLEIVQATMREREGQSAKVRQLAN